MARRGAGTPLLLLLLHLGGTLGCASVSVHPPIVPLGSAVTASCTIQRELCRGLEQDKVRIRWMLDNKLVAGSQHQGPGGTEVSNLTLPRFNHTHARLWCCVEWNGTKQRLSMAEIRAGYPPAKPLNLSCALNLSDYGLTCQWEQGADSHLPTSIVLKCTGSRGQAVTGCTPRGGHSHCTVPRRLLQLYRQMEIWVSATNALGTAESEHLHIDPMDVAKLDPPTLQSIQSIPFQTDCIALAWDAAWGTEHMELQCELRYRAPGDPAWALVTGIMGRAGTAQRCGFLFGTQYHFQMRCRRNSASALAYWSEWSLGRNYTTHEKAPTGKLDAWWGAQPAGTGERLEVQLRWKAPRQREANGRVLGYRITLSPRRRGRDPTTVCNTTHTQCNFSVPAGTSRVYLSAYNSAGESAPTEVALLERKGQPLAGLRAVPGGERSLWVHWEAPLAPVVAYVLEWQRVTAEPGHCNACWQMERDGAATTALIQDGIEPFQRYNISLYPLYGDTVGVPVHTTAYSQQKAPSHAPKLHLKRISKSEAELCWESLPVEMQNGFITSYTIFWANSITNGASATVNPSLSSFIIRGLKPSTLYKVHIMASTAAGSTNGTSLTLVTRALDDSEIQFLFLTLGLVFVVLMALLICFQKNERMKEQLWPSVPDPANSSLGKWVPAAVPQEPLQVLATREPGPAAISTVTVLEREAGKQPGKEHPALPAAVPALSRPYVRQDGPGEPVQYARVGAAGYRGQRLLPEPAPRFYENLRGGGGGAGDWGFLEEPPATFPLLQGLRIGGAEELHECRAD
ncbi:granulocyte colony-stimulating factor receptor [Oenanthe melanoleuca]|uniref:granulocyte colony-stimulating factor receptor n=1 Tax=Oenanthe melanoleuca TaxID=2939378 RepID=UPI0024C190B1|nr:granulocyte colony-stimulating factor receptor [Oenanthe melanoleuca]XP_056365228.1 granulocyte colony-stimulating factor receptor [Oenanthe melanoleuca]XP_056365229.1 granulocyte colony-stimulating factor receptor [Oenanthe melanoleuca]XP_056365230.1 granulocyte colony-stimulating factor receptor [Oenanthe melanoleuca]XP_056365232.1 granulocyte colony-stimulating factor receptor [Oenanthe melanoleuca]